jgi:hypothetical protein
MTRQRRKLTPFALFLALFLSGCTLATVIFRHGQSLSMSAEGGDAAPSNVDVTDTQKTYIESRSAASERLFDLAFASLAALLGLRFSEKTRVRIDGHGPFAACGLLLVSIYSAFLFQVGVGHALEGPLNEIYGPALSYPIVLQFWSLFGAALILAVSLFRPAGRRMNPLILAAGTVAMLFAPPVRAQSQPGLEACVRSWAASRDLELPGEAVQDATKLVEGVARKREIVLSLVDPCDWTGTLLDEIRFTAISDGGAARGDAAGRVLAPLFHSAVKALEDPTFASGDLLDRLLSIAQVWREPSAIVEVEAGTRSLFVTILDPRHPQRPRRGYTRWTVRLPPGSYELRASERGKIVEKRTIALRDGERYFFSLEAPKP